MKKFIVISHTHWDREWYMPFELFRLKLIDLIDAVIEIIDRQPEYIFHLDCQTVVLDDYLVVRPERRALLKKLITSGNLIVGPWYLQSDFFLTSGESVIRNLLEGRAGAEEFGKCCNVGYAPDQFGNVGQLPQILRGFGIDTFISGRGFSLYQTDAQTGQVSRRHMPSEFIWEGVDGSRVTAMYMLCWYNNAQHIPEEQDKAKLLLDINHEIFSKHNITPYTLLMNGVDHLEAQDDVLEIIGKLNESLPDTHVVQTDLETYTNMVKDYIEENKLSPYVHSGHLAYGGDYELLRGCWSTRSYIKRLNVIAQDGLEARNEPLHSLLELSGMHGAYDNGRFRHMWKELMKNHPHDSICCCSRDEVIDHMEDNYARLAEISEETLRRGLEVAAHHHGSVHTDGKNYMILVANTLDTELSGVVRATVAVPVSEGIAGFQLKDNSGSELPFTLLSRRTGMYDVFSPLNLPGVLDCEFFDIEFYARSIKPFAVKTFALIPSDIELKAQKNAAANSTVNNPVIENEFYRIECRGARADITIKSTGVTLEDAVKWKDCGDRGDSYVFRPAEEAPIFSDGASGSAEVTESYPGHSVIRVKNTLTLPAEYDFDKLARSSAAVTCDVEFTLRLDSHSDTIELGYSVKNTAKDHRLRLLVKNGLGGGTLITDSSFEVSVKHDDELFPLTDYRGFCNATFAAVEQGGKGFAVFTEGLHEVEQTDDYLALTVVRSTGMITRTDGFKPGGGRYWEAPGNQCLRTFSGRVGLHSYSGGHLGAGIFKRARAFRNPLIAYASSMDVRKYSGGRFAVQDAKLAKFYYKADPYAAVTLADNTSYVTVDNPNIAVSALKKSFDGSAIVLRLFNLGDAEESCTVRVRGSISEADLAETGLRPIGNDEAVLSFGKKQIKTLVISLPQVKN